MNAVQLPLMVYDHDGGYFHKYEQGPKEWKTFLESELRNMNSVEDDLLPIIVHTKPLPIGYVIAVGERFRSKDGRSALRIYSTCWPHSAPPLKRLDVLVQLLRSQNMELRHDSGDTFDLPSFSFIDDNSSNDFELDNEHALQMSGFEFSRLNKIRTTGPSDAQVCRVWALSPPDIRLKTELMIGYNKHEQNESHRFWLHEIIDETYSELEKHDQVMVNTFSEYRGSLFDLLSKVDNFEELGSEWWKNLCLCLDQAGVASTLDLNSLIRLYLHHAARKPKSEDSDRYRSAALRKLSVGLRLSQHDLLNIFINNSKKELNRLEVEEFDPEHRLLIVRYLLDRKPKYKLNSLIKYLSVLDDQQVNLLINSIDLEELVSVDQVREYRSLRGKENWEAVIKAIQQLRNRKSEFFHCLLQNQLRSQNPSLIHVLISRLSSKEESPVLFIDSSLLAILSKFKASEQHVLVNPELFSNLEIAPKEVNTEEFLQNLVQAQLSLLNEGEKGGNKVVDSMIIQTPRVLRGKHFASPKSMLMWLNLMYDNMSESQRSRFAPTLADYHPDYRTNKFLQWIFNKATDSELSNYCKRHGTKKYLEIINTIDNTYFKNRLSKKARFGFALPLSASKKTVANLNTRQILLKSFQFSLIKNTRDRLSLLFAFILTFVLVLVPALTYMKMINIFDDAALSLFGSFPKTQGNLSFLVGNLFVFGLVSLRWLRRRGHWKKKLKEALS